MNNYVVYVVLNPLKPGIFKYGRHVFKLEPIYVGSGSVDRPRESARRKLQWTGLSTDERREFNKVIFSGLNKEEALTEEFILTELIGRLNSNDGPLVNKRAGYTMSTEISSVIKESLTGDKSPKFGVEVSVEIRDKIRKSLTGRKTPDEVKVKMSASQKLRREKENNRSII